jgi:hypothetical protein
MRRFFLLLLIFPLAGCYADQKKQLLTCDRDGQQLAKSQISKEPLVGNPFLSWGNENELCMGLHGYRLIDGVCPAKNVNPDPKRFPDGWILIKLLKSKSVECYEPSSWAGRQIRRFERLLNQTSN